MLFLSAPAAVEPELMGPRSSTASGVAFMTLPARPARRRAGGQRAEAQVLAQRAPLVVGPEDAAFLQQRHDRVGELVQPARRDVRDEDEPVAGVRLHQAVSGAVRAATRTASSRPGTWPVRPKPSSMVTKSSRPRSASVMTSTQ
jgi:hypothetical protein